MRRPVERAFRVKAQSLADSLRQGINIDVPAGQIALCQRAGDRIGLAPQPVGKSERPAVVFKLCGRPLSWFPVRERVQRFPEIQALYLAQPVDVVTVRPADEAIEVIRVDVAGRVVVVVERAEDLAAVQRLINQVGERNPPPPALLSIEADGAVRRRRQRIARR